MNIFAHQGFHEFVIATGYKFEAIEQWVAEMNSPWKVTPLFTGLNTQTGGRIKRCMEFANGERVLATYGDGLGNVKISKLIDFHERHNKMATVTAVRPPARFGVLESSNGLVTHFGEKNQTDAGWINGGFFVLEPEVVDLIRNDAEPFETGAMPRLVKNENLAAYHHQGFWQPMDTLREKQELTNFATKVTPPWLEEIK
jgi:glucose-1-phosphate cytidylyltransferase